MKVNTNQHIYNRKSYIIVGITCFKINYNMLTKYEMFDALTSHPQNALDFLFSDFLRIQVVLKSVNTKVREFIRDFVREVNYFHCKSVRML